MEDPFKGNPMDAKITIEVGDFIVTMQGELDPPIVKTHRWDNDFYHHDKGMATDGITEINMNLKPSKVMKIERVRWTIPITIRPRIEE